MTNATIVVIVNLSLHKQPNIKLSYQSNIVCGHTSGS